MRLMLYLGLMVAVWLLPGCSWFHAKRPTTAPAPAPAPAIVTPAQTADAYVLTVNAAGRFVILNFPSGQMLAVGQSMYIYRNGLKVAEVKISGPRQENNIVADIISGDARKGDEARGE